MSDLVAFLTGVWDELEKVARAAATYSTSDRWEIDQKPGQNPWHTGLWISVVDSTWDACIGPAVAEHTIRHDPARVLADIAAKRKIVERAQGWDGPGWWPNDILCLLAQPYADRPGFDEAWRV